MKAVLCDIDNTLSLASWRNQYKGDWDTYHKLSTDDEPVSEIIEAVNALAAAGIAVIIITARPERWRGITIEWLSHHRVAGDGLLMRPDDDWRPSPIVKMELAVSHFGPDLADHVSLVIDDRDDVLEAFRALGITCIQSWVGK